MAIETNTVDPANEAARVKAAYKSQSSSTEDISSMFQTLFLAQLKTQDPLDPVDNGEFLNQLSQFNSLEQLTSVNSNLEALLDKKSLAEASSMIGKLVSGVNSETGKTVGGYVSGIQMNSGSYNLVFSDGSILNYNNVTEVYGYST